MSSEQGTNAPSDNPSNSQSSMVENISSTAGTSPTLVKGELDDFQFSELSDAKPYYSVKSFNEEDLMNINLTKAAVPAQAQTDKKVQPVSYYFPAPNEDPKFDADIHEYCLKHADTLKFGNVSSSIVAHNSLTPFYPLTRAPETALSFREAITLMKNFQSFHYSNKDSSLKRLEKWLAWRSNFFNRLKFVESSPAQAAVILKRLLPETLVCKLDVEDPTTTAEQIADNVNSLLYGDNDVSIVAWQGIVSCLSTPTKSAVDSLQQLATWFSSDPHLKDQYESLCKASLSIIPLDARRRIREWKQYRRGDYKEFWRRLRREISSCVSEDEMFSFSRSRYIATKTIDDYDKPSTSKRRKRSRRSNYSQAECSEPVDRPLARSRPYY